MDIDKKVASIDDRKSVVEGQVEQDAVNKIKPESLAHLSDDEIALRSQKLTRKMDLFSEHQLTFPPQALHTMYIVPICTITGHGASMAWCLEPKTQS